MIMLLVYICLYHSKILLVVSESIKFKDLLQILLICNLSLRNYTTLHHEIFKVIFWAFYLADLGNPLLGFWRISFYLILRAYFLICTIFVFILFLWKKPLIFYDVIYFDSLWFIFLKQSHYQLFNFFWNFYISRKFNLVFYNCISYFTCGGCFKRQSSKQ